MESKIDKVKELIIQDELDTKSRKRDRIYKRSYLYAILREEGWNLTNIGSLFNRDHATVINALRIFDNYYHKDNIYDRYIRHYDVIFKPDMTDLMKSKNDIYKDILECNNTTALKQIKDNILSGLYDNMTTLFIYACVQLTI